MIDNSWPSYLFIRASILGFRVVAPLSILYTVARPFLPVSCGFSNHLVNVLSIYPLAETIFCLFVYFPLRAKSQEPATHPPLQSREAHGQLLERCAKTIDDPARYLRKWFRDAPIEEIKKDNVREFCSWAFYNADGVANVQKSDGEGLEHCVQMIEDALGRKLGEGRGSARAIRLTVDPVLCWHRPLIWYGIVSLVDNIACLRLLYSGFKLYRPRPSILPKTFPFRPQTLLSRRRSPTKYLSYWYRPHRSHTALPILFIHGIGIGLDTYVPFFNDVPEDIGIIAVEILPISFRITESMLRSEVFCREVQAILLRHGLDKVVLAGHSYGTVLATNILKHADVSQYIDSIVLIDPVSILLHLPDVAYNFTFRTPRHANEHQLYYYASKDMGVAHTLGRGFFWSENILWKEDLGDRPLLVSLAGKDLIVPVHNVAKYLTDEDEGWRFEKLEKKTKDRKLGRHVWSTKRASSGGSGHGPLKVLWHEDLDHASLLDVTAARRRLAQDVAAQTQVQPIN